ncbi:tRNA (adenosine(37)-N6)-threonylcarbamoyltransferase complex ATPase subunit type 1 TsaE [Motilibacter sp. E257]|uniref:tRNA threonylcarbamoyladenosine biosynthesis protein TsaE n=1 Tax=Motilibacter deserti TaxID=2714956 RepID=A0ABX0GRA4_9ACTN|nr:tRNA (adenosine(37)-N6)-threonylcarbamoyltransferase complex ATPase subunit type 1 TsaE [Motilibacter deserti]NHC13384.1 tRNA (adenosine(37)-N6)-threonylcarbamoyltransferase complex ATPase subunit type 1 TsaE [Motilibacter deserti]
MTYAVAGRAGTTELAARLAPELRAGDVLLLRGTLGSGKTAFVQDLSAALGYEGPVTSPTFTLANFYECPGLTVLHVDAYRLDSVAEFRDLGLVDYAERSVTVVEWGDLVAEDYPGHLLVEVALVPDSEEARVFTLSGGSPRWAALLDGLAALPGSELRVTG